MDIPIVQKKRKRSKDAKRKISDENYDTSSKNKPMEEEIDDEPGFAKQYNIVKNVLEFLPIADLTKAGQVCKLWSEVTRVVRRQRRNKPYIIIYHPSPLEERKTVKVVVDYFNDLTRPFSVRRLHGPEFPIEYIQLRTLEFNINVESIPKESFEEYEPFLWNTFKKYWEPQLVLFFGTRGMQSYVSARIAEADEASAPDDNQKNKMTNHEALFGRIQKNIPCLGVLSNGIMASITESADAETLELEEPILPMIIGLAIPKLPGLKIKIFIFDKNNRPQFSRKMRKSTCRALLNITKKDNVKGIVLFDPNYRRKSVIQQAINKYLIKNPNVAVGGGIIEECYSSTSGKAKVLACGLIICGDDNVQVGVAGMYDSKISLKNERQLLKFKEAGMDSPGTNSFAFAFGCTGRGFHMHGVNDAETTLFRRHYPNTPLIGTFTGGEFVREFVPGLDNTLNPQKDGVKLSTYSTVFMFVSCKHPI